MTEREVMQLVGWLLLAPVIVWAVISIYEALKEGRSKEREEEEIDLVYREMYGDEDEPIKKGDTE